MPHSYDYEYIYRIYRLHPIIWQYMASGFVNMSLLSIVYQEMKMYVFAL